jgi:hypothetical protein
LGSDSCKALHGAGERLDVFCHVNIHLPWGLPPLPELRNQLLRAVCVPKYPVQAVACFDGVRNAVTPVQSHAGAAEPAEERAYDHESRDRTMAGNGLASINAW